MFRYFDYDTGQTYDGKSSTTVDVMNPQVSGDRILYNVSTGSNQDLFVWDTRVAKTAGVLSSFVMSNETVNETAGQIAGNDLVYLSGTCACLGETRGPKHLAQVDTRSALRTAPACA